MFPVDSLPSGYYEERIKVDEEKRKARATAMAQYGGTMQKPQQLAVAQQPHHIQAPTAQNLPQSLLQRPALSRPASSSLLGNILQGFVRASASPPGTPSVRTPSPSNQKQLGDVPTGTAPRAAGREDTAKGKRDDREDLLCFLGRG